MQGVLVRGIGGFYYAVDETGAEYTLRAQAKFRRQHLKPKIGDMVNFEPGNGEEEGWITEILPRKNELVRPPVANIDVICVVAASAVPAADRMLVDRLLINARRAGIRPMLIVTKADLDKANAEAIAAEYTGAEVEPHIVSVETGEGVDELREALKGLTHAFAGQSGAGKSSLINALYGLSMETGDLSRKIDRGKNTTRRCELVTVPGGGRVLDTPGFSLLETETFDP
ncbi:MAG: ribosome small subunit-dependent GTPase A, partial [Clostridia bacterium]|nr:ribosome small subunit-dependent GTPase A [Clostridia bacterium]